MSNENQNNAEIKLEEELNLAKEFTPPTYEEWKKVVEVDLKGVPFEKKLVTKTYEGINFQPIYRMEDIENLPHVNSAPGFDGYVRGTNAAGYRGKAWDVAQEIVYALPEEYNEALKNDLSKGQTAISLLFDKASADGIDADEAETSLVGQGGTSVSSVKCLEAALKDVDVTKYPVNIKAGASSYEALLLLAAYAKKNGIDFSAIKGSVDGDPIGVLASEGKLNVSLETAFSEMKEAAAYAAKNNGNIRTTGVSGLNYNNAGASAVQELAFTMATAVEYMNQLTSSGLTADEAAKSVRFTFGIGSFYFMEIAKLRAARLLWSKIAEAYGAGKEAAKIVMHGRTSAFNQTVFDPYVNLLRTTTEAFSAVVGGVDSLHTNPFDERFGQASEFSRRIARNTQIILKEETHLDSLIDPAGGSYFVEKLTDEVAKAAWAVFQEIEKLGGMLKALEAGYPQSEIEKVVAARNKDFAKRKAVIVGNNMYANVKEEKLQVNSVDNKKVQEAKKKELQSKSATVKGLSAEELIASLAEGATIGMVSKAIRKDGASISVKPVAATFAAAIYESLRNSALAYQEKNGKLPQIFLANMGPVRQHKGRADFSRGFFEPGGFDVVYPNGFKTTEEAAEAAVASGARAVVLCSTDDTYPELVPSFVKAVKAKDAGITVLLAGYPADQVEQHKVSGIDEFIFLGADVPQILSNLMTKIGALK